ncbi:MAG TPA: hypothetical protein VK745_10070 [Polyangiaceae bacterium]|nr:hypothetical protein [Polyangiaceae bacterium]
MRTSKVGWFALSAAALTLIQACGSSDKSSPDGSSGASASSAGASSTSAGASGAVAAAGSGVVAPTGPAGSCSAPDTRVTEIDVGATVVQSEDEAALKPLAIAAIPSGGSRVSWLGSDGMIHVTTLNADDTVNTSAGTVNIAGNDYGDIYADDNGGVLMVSRDSVGGGTLNCGDPTNLCGTPPSPAIPCYDMYMVRFDGTKETWATQLTQSSAQHPPYLTSKTDTSNVIFIWWYAHHSRIAFDGANYAGYYGAAISVSQAGCVNIHQGDEMRVVDPSGNLLTGHNSFDWGCSHSGYERIVWDPSAKKFITVCKNDAPTGGKSGRLAFAPATSTIYPLDLYYSNMGNITLASGGGYWLTTSDIRAGQTPNMDGLADVHLLHFSTGAPDKDLVLASDAGLNDRAPHLTQYGASHLLAAWDTSTATGDLTAKSPNRKLYVQVLDSTSGAAVSSPIAVPVLNNRYQEMKPFPDGSVAYPAPGSTSTKIKILRVMPCQ